jgi:predicted RNA-binding protein Jag
MENQVDMEKVERLNQLKAQQEQIEKEIAIQSKLAQNDIKKAEAIQQAKNDLYLKIKKLNDIEIIKKHNIAQFPQLNSVKQLSKIEVKPWTYLYDENGLNQKWEGDKISEDFEGTLISYKGHTLSFWPSGKVEIPYSVANSCREYTVKGAIKKIDEFEEEKERKNLDIQRKTAALQSATEFLKKSIEESNIKATIESKKSGHYISSNRREWIEYDVLEIKFENGNFIKYRVGYQWNKELSSITYTLSLIEFKDNRLDDVKKDPQKLLNHLK